MGSFAEEKKEEEKLRNSNIKLPIIKTPAKPRVNSAMLKRISTKDDLETNSKKFESGKGNFREEVMGEY